MGQIIDQATVVMECDTAPRVITNSSSIDTTNRGVIRLQPGPAFVRSNILPNPSFEIDTTGWFAATNCTIARDTTYAHEGGTACLAVTATANGPNMAINTNPRFAVSPSTPYRVTCYVLISPTGVTDYVTPYLYWYDAAAATISFLSGNSDPDTYLTPAQRDGFQQCSVEGVSPSNAASAALQLGWAPYTPLGATQINAGEVHYVDDCTMTYSPSITGLRLTAGTQIGRAIVLVNESDYDLVFAAPGTSLVADGAVKNMGYVFDDPANGYFGQIGVGDVAAQTSREFTWTGSLWVGAA